MMPVSYRIDPSLECIFVTLQGIITDEDLIKGQQSMFRDALFEGRYSRLVVAMEVTKLVVTADTVRSVAKAAVDRGLRKAALVANSEVTYGVMRMYEGYAIDADCFVSRDANEALAWLLGRPSSDGLSCAGAG